MKEYGYINLYEDPEGNVVCTGVYNTDEAARHCAASFGYIDTVLITWNGK